MILVKKHKRSSHSIQEIDCSKTLTQLLFERPLRTMETPQESLTLSGQTFPASQQQIWADPTPLVILGSFCNE